MEIWNSDFLESVMTELAEAESEMYEDGSYDAHVELESGQEGFASVEINDVMAQAKAQIATLQKQLKESEERLRITTELVDFELITELEDRIRTALKENQ